MAGITVYTEDYRSRNRYRFLSFFLMLWGLINFACRVRDATDSVHSELWAASAFVLMLGAFMTLIVLSMDRVDKWVKYATMFMLIIGGILFMVTGGVVVDEVCADSSACCCLVYG
eukprot:149292_1